MLKNRKYIISLVQEPQKYIVEDMLKAYDYDRECTIDSGTGFPNRSMAFNEINWAVSRRGLPLLLEGFVSNMNLDYYTYSIFVEEIKKAYDNKEFSWQRENKDGN